MNNVKDAATKIKEEGYTIVQLLLFKFDRTLAILGLVVIAIFTINADKISTEAQMIITSVTTALGIVLGVRLGSK